MNHAEPQRVLRQGRKLFALLGVLVVVALAPASPLAVDNPIVLENQQPGSGNWMWSKLADDTAQQIKGYASATSVNQNQDLTFYVTVNPVQSYTIDFYRFGWDAGAGARARALDCVCMSVRSAASSRPRAPQMPPQASSSATGRPATR